MKREGMKLNILAALFLALGFILPMLTGQIPAIGKSLLPMHIPVFLCAFLCGWERGAAVGFILPLFRSLIFSVPVMFPTAIAVAFEMTTYGIVAGILYGLFKKKSIVAIYSSMLIAMIAGRILRCAAEFILLDFFGSGFVFAAFVSGVLLHSIPGIILQLFVVPAVMLALKKAKR